MKKFPITLAACISGLLAGMTGCGGSGQDAAEKNAATTEISFAGAAIDGHIARAMVFLDTNNNSTRDPWEAFAFTDNDGYYSYNPTTQTNYCASTVTSEQAQYCLRTIQTTSSVVLRIDGGYDVLTGEPFEGQLSRRVEVVNDQVPFSVISPITTLLVSAATDAEASAILRSLDLTADDLDIDYVNSSDIVNSKLLNISLTLHKLASVLSDRLTDTYNKIGDDFGTPNDASAIIYEQLAKELASGETSLAELITSETIVRILDDAEENIRQIYKDNDYDLPTDMNASQFERVTQTAVKIPELVNSLISSEQTNQMQEDVTGGVKAVESVVIKTLQETTTDNSIDNAINFFTNSNNQDLIESLTESLAGDDSDLSSLINHNFTTGMDSTESISNLVKIAETIEPFTSIGGFKIKVSDMDLGYAPDELKDQEVEFYFQGNSNSLNGSFLACVKYIEDAKVDGTLGKGNTRGELVKGYWSLLGASENNLKSYSLLLTIEFLGAKYSAVIKPAESIVVNGETIKQYRFDNNGDFITWRSAEGIGPIDSVPNSSSECEQRLPSRLGF
jgi:hypothetical protein